MISNSIPSVIGIAISGGSRFNNYVNAILTASTQCILGVLKGIGKSQIRSIRWGVSVREDTCSGPSGL